MAKGDDDEGERDVDVLAAEREKWRKVRTCSRVSASTCSDCRKECCFEGWRRKVFEKKTRGETLCTPCFERRYDPDAARKRKAEAVAAAKDREERTKFAREEVRRRAAGLPPVDGWHREGALIVNDRTGEKRGFFQ